MRSPKEAREAKAELINRGHMMQALLDQEGYQYLTERLGELADNAKDEAIASKTYDELCERRGFIRGLETLEREVTTIINRGKKQELLTSK